MGAASRAARQGPYSDLIARLFLEDGWAVEHISDTYEESKIYVRNCIDEYRKWLERERELD